MIKIRTSFKTISGILLVLCFCFINWLIISALKETCEEKQVRRLYPELINARVLSLRTDNKNYKADILEFNGGFIMSICECGYPFYRSVRVGDSVYKAPNSLVFNVMREDSTFSVDISCPK